MDGEVTVVMKYIRFLKRHPRFQWSLSPSDTCLRRAAVHPQSDEKNGTVVAMFFANLCELLLLVLKI